MNNKDQGSGTGQSDRDADINNEVSRHAPITSVLPSSTSLTARRDERPDLNLPFEENWDTVPNNESNIGALELNFFCSSSLIGSDPQRFPDSLSGSNVLQHQGNNHDNNLDLSLSLSPMGSQVDQGMNGVSANTTRVLPSKRRYSDIAGGEEISTGESGDIEVVIGEGSFPNMQNQGQAGAILGMAQQLAAPSHANNSYGTELANIHPSSEVGAAIGNQGLVPIPNMPNQSRYAPIAPRAPRARRAPRYIRTTRNPHGCPRGLVATALSHDQARSPSAVGGATSVPPLRYAPVFLPVHSGPRNEATAPLYNSRSFHGHWIPNPQYVNGNRSAIAPSGRSTLFYGNLPPIHYEQLGSSASNINANPSNAPPHPERDHMHQHGSAENANGSGNSSAAAARSGTRAPRRGGHVLRPRPIPVFASMLFPDNPELRARIMNQVRATLEHLDTTAMRPMGAANEHNMTIEEVIQILRIVHIPIGAANQDVNSGLTEEEILNRIKRENFELVGEDTSENEEKCVVCQEEFVKGEEVGRLDICVHRFHVNCIKQWLLRKNVCPICRKTALAIDVDDDDE